MIFQDGAKFKEENVFGVTKLMLVYEKYKLLIVLVPDLSQCIWRLRNLVKISRKLDCLVVFVTKAAEEHGFLNAVIGIAA